MRSAKEVLPTDRYGSIVHDWNAFYCINAFFQVKGSETRRTTFGDRLCTQCVYCSPRPVDYSERLYDRFHLSAHNDGEYHFLHVQANYDKWQILYTRTAASQKPPLPTRKKRSFTGTLVVFTNTSPC